jgi:type I restriction enzyme, S subunit
MSNTIQGKNGLVPELRFPEFINEDEWVEKSLGKVATFSKGKGISKSDISEGGSLPCIRYGELYTHYKEVIKDIKSSTNLLPEDLIISEVNDVIIPSSGETQIDIATASCLLRSGVALGGDLNIIKSKINGVFLSYYLNYTKKREIAQMAQGISVVHLYSHQLKNLQINIPKPGEQQKIASCLSSLDELIAAQTEKLEALQAHKKGLMQNLFPQEGQSVPNYRFPEFEEDGEWKLPKLVDKMDIFRGASPRPQGDPRYYGGKVPRLMIEDVTRDGKYCTPKIDSLTEEGALKSRFLKKGSVVLSCSGTRVAIPGILEVDACIHDGWLGFKNLKEVDTEFLYYHFCNLHEKIQGDALAGGVFNNLTTRILKEMKLGFPNLPEQQKIASFLSELDGLISAQEEKIQQLQKHKKGLMQGLFPTISNS